MAYPLTPKIEFPLEKYKVNGWRFKRKTTIKKTYWGIHLGEDIIRPAGTKVRCIGRGRVVYSAFHPGTKKHGNWGNIIIAHKNPENKKAFYSLYAHLQKRYVLKGQKTDIGKIIGIIGKKHTPENGWWPEHLHFGIYVGPWKGKILPGYWKKDQGRTKISYWKEPSKFIKKYQT